MNLCSLHRVFTGIKSVNHLFDLHIEYGEPTREEFEKQLASDFDWELVTALNHLMDELFLNKKRIGTRLTWIKVFIQNPEFLNLDRKSKANEIIRFFPDCTGIVFAMLDNKEITPQKLWDTFIK